MPVRETVELDFEVETKDAEKSIKKLNSSLDGLGKSIDDLGENTGGLEQNIERSNASFKSQRNAIDKSSKKTKGYSGVVKELTSEIGENLGISEGWIEALGGPLALAIGGIIASVAGLISVYQKLKEEQKELNLISLTSTERIDELGSSFQSLRDSVISYTEALKGASVAQVEQAARGTGLRIQELLTQRQELQNRLRAVEAGGDIAEIFGVTAGSATLVEETQNRIDQVNEEIERLEANLQQLTTTSISTARERETIAQRNAEIDALEAKRENEREARQASNEQSERERLARLAAIRRMASEAYLKNLQRERDIEAAIEADRQANAEKEAQRWQARIEAENLRLRLQEQEREQLERQAELRQREIEQIQSLANAYQNSLGSGIEAATAAYRELMEAQGESVTTSDLALVAIDDTFQQISDTLSGTFRGAVEGAVEAWVSGSKSMGEAAKDAARQIIDSLVARAIVEVVVNTAQAIAAFASYRYDQGVQYLAAAAAWGAVGVVAGGAKAAIGGGGGGGGGGRQERPSETPDNQNNQGGNQQGMTVINNFNQPIFDTEAQVGRTIRQNLEAERRRY